MFVASHFVYRKELTIDMGLWEWKQWRSRKDLKWKKSEKLDFNLDLVWLTVHKLEKIWVGKSF